MHLTLSFHRKRGVDDRSRRDQVEVRQQAFAEQLGSMTDTYLEWMAALGDEGFSREGNIVYDTVQQNTYLVAVVDTYGKCSSFLIFFLVTPCRYLSPTNPFARRHSLNISRFFASRYCPLRTLQPHRGCLGKSP